MRAPTRCPCGTGDVYADCCGRFHRGDAVPATAEQLMRSRFTAFAVGDAAYLLATWHPSTRPRQVDLDPEQTWVRLEILDRVGGGLLEPDGIVEFRAYYRIDKQRGQLHERSRFLRTADGWRYLGATAPPARV